MRQGKKFILTLILWAMGFSLAMQPALACSIYVPNVDVDASLSNAELKALVDECVDSDCIFTLIESSHNYFELALKSDPVASKIATVSSSGINLYDFTDKQEIYTHFTAADLFNAYDRLTDYDLALNRTQLIAAIGAHFTTKEDNIFAGTSVQIRSNDYYESVSEAEDNVANNNQDPQRCYDMKIIKGDNYYALIEEDRGVCEYQEDDYVLCPYYKYKGSNSNPYEPIEPTPPGEIVTSPTPTEITYVDPSTTIFVLCGLAICCLTSGIFGIGGILIYRRRKRASKN